MQKSILILKDTKNAFLIIETDAEENKKYKHILNEILKLMKKSNFSYSLLTDQNELILDWINWENYKNFYIKYHNECACKYKLFFDVQKHKTFMKINLVEIKKNNLLKSEYLNLQQYCISTLINFITYNFYKSHK